MGQINLRLAQEKQTMNNPDILHELTRIADALERSAVLAVSVEEQLRRMSHPRKTEVLGLCSAPSAQFIFIGGDNSDACWYSLDSESRQVPIQENAIAGRIIGISLVDRHYKSDTTTKLDIRIAADRDYIIRTGLGSVASRCLLLSLWKLPPSGLREILTIAVKRGTTESKVVFAEVYQGGSRIQYDWVESADWLKMALALADRANQEF
ncbi:MAG: hypothetical protein KME30_19020 [Iphinoe sp. HA4291-MV1]|jgi:hypothetical protein|nr:hypothetical protein [Iphinoe sp. HA4291-MV1]